MAHTQWAPARYRMTVQDLLNPLDAAARAGGRSPSPAAPRLRPVTVWPASAYPQQQQEEEYEYVYGSSSDEDEPPSASTSASTSTQPSVWTSRARSPSIPPPPGPYPPHPPPQSYPHHTYNAHVQQAPPPPPPTSYTHGSSYMQLHPPQYAYPHAPAAYPYPYYAATPAPPPPPPPPAPAPVSASAREGSPLADHGWRRAASDATQAQPCANCARRGFVCVPTFKGRATACTTCQQLKIKCSFAEAASVAAAQLSARIAAERDIEMRASAFGPENVVKCKNCGWRNYICVPRDSARGRACTKCYSMKIKCSYNDYEDPQILAAAAAAAAAARAAAAPAPPPQPEGSDVDELESDDEMRVRAMHPAPPKRCKSCEWRGFECVSAPKSRGNSCEKCRQMKIKCSFSDERGASCSQCHRLKVRCAHMHLQPGPRVRVMGVRKGAPSTFKPRNAPPDAPSPSSPTQ